VRRDGERAAGRASAKPRGHQRHAPAEGGRVAPRRA
jgi:hypothetical protein